ncbi:MAG TPA: addiction module toxin RelE [Crenotrichaceae bacterium]|nr:addiction module toxin RelE [Crenotrichaceae bacterium]
MARPLRIEYPGALTHVKSFCNPGSRIFLEQSNRHVFIGLLDELLVQYKINCYAYCLLDDHYHLLVETATMNLSQMMRSLNGRYTQYFNREYHQAGAVFRGRFKSVVVQKELYLLEMCRHIVLNPLRADIVDNPEDYVWSSYRATAGLDQAPSWLIVDELLKCFDNNRQKATRQYKDYVRKGIDSTFSARVIQQSFLGTEQFIDEVQKRVSQQ